MATTQQFKFGDRVIHAAKPEWGVGTVTQARFGSHEGEQCQMLTLRFERAGLKKLSTAIADLRPASEAERPAGAIAEAPQTDAAGANSTDEWLRAIEAGDPAKAMARLPQAVSDPFSTLKQRLRATLELYRFSDRGASLLDWAAAQTGMADPLSRFSRQELEQFFGRFAHARDEQLRSLAEEAKRGAPGLVDALLPEAPAAARNALRPPHARR